MHVSGSQVRGLFRCHTSVHKWFAVEGEGGEIPLNLVNLALSVSFVHCYCGSNVLISWEECGVWDLEELEVFHTVQLTINVTLHSLCQSGISAVLFFFHLSSLFLFSAQLPAKSARQCDTGLSLLFDLVVKTTDFCAPPSWVLKWSRRNREPKLTAVLVHFA